VTAYNYYDHLYPRAPPFKGIVTKADRLTASLYDLKIQQDSDDPNGNVFFLLNDHPNWDNVQFNFVNLISSLISSKLSK